MLTLKESVRWLTVKGRHTEAWDSLKWIRGDDGPETQLEMDEIRMDIQTEENVKEGFQLKRRLSCHVNTDLLLTANRNGDCS